MMRLRNSATQAHILALGMPLALIAGAYGFEYIGGLFPCQLCWWQRYADFVAIGLGLSAFAFSASLRPWFVRGAALALFASGIIGLMHWGEEQHYWQVLTTCLASHSADVTRFNLNEIVPCDQPQWLGPFGLPISLAAWNMIFSLPSAVFALFLSFRSKIYG
jgi:disulfide bond formation protein DsbB